MGRKGYSDEGTLIKGTVESHLEKMGEIKTTRLTLIWLTRLRTTNRFGDTEVR